MMRRNMDELADVLRKALPKFDEFFDYQKDAIEQLAEMNPKDAIQLLYYPPGKGKSITALAALAHLGYETARVVAPPSTHQEWFQIGEILGMEIIAMSHAKFRQSFYADDVAQYWPLIADEFHLFGGHHAVGWKQLQKAVRRRQAPVILCSATPNYNDAERCYCIERLMNPQPGGYITWVRNHCVTKENPYGMMPLIEGLKDGQSAADYLSKLPNTTYLPDDAVYTIVDIPLVTEIPDEFTDYGVNRRQSRLIASQMEGKFQLRVLQRVNEKDELHDHIVDMLTELIGQSATSVLIYSDSSTIARAAWKSCLALNARAGLITGADTKKAKEEKLNMFRDGDMDILIGTASLATGTDGLNTVCDTLIILDDTEDPSLRRQLVGRVLDRGVTKSLSKAVYRLTF